MYRAATSFPHDAQMSSIFPRRGQVNLDEDRGPRLVDLDDDVADDVFEALSSRTTRHIFRELHESPQTASDLAEVTDTSVQNVQYHLSKLVDVDLVEVADVWYSERGTEMKVYAPTDESLVLFAGGDAEGTFRSLLKRLVGGLGVLAPASLLVWWVATQIRGDWWSGDAAPTAGDGGGVSIAAEGAKTAAESASGGLDPALVAGVAFFVGGAFVLALATGYWYARN
jgi:DNA-binding transcriptional ArsR family regulator